MQIARNQAFITGVIAVIAFDTVASIASRATDIPYFWATFGSWIVYIGIGYFAARINPESPLRVAAITGLISGLADASLGWAVSWAIGPGRVAGGITATQWLLTAAFVVGFATGFAALGGSFARMQASRPAR